MRQLLPLQKTTVDVVCCEPIGTVYDSKGNKVETPAPSKCQVGSLPLIMDSVLRAEFAGKSSSG